MTDASENIFFLSCECMQLFFYATYFFSRYSSFFVLNFFSALWYKQKNVLIRERFRYGTPSVYNPNAKNIIVATAINTIPT